MDFCPSCGEFVSELRENTGWCPECSRESNEILCDGCGRAFKADQRTRLKCPTCRYAGWLTKNADLLEESLSSGISFSRAIKEVRLATRPKCRNCGDVMSKGIFCGKPQCRKAFIRYKQNKFKKKMPEEQAIREALAA